MVMLPLATSLSLMEAVAGVLLRRLALGVPRLGSVVALRVNLLTATNSFFHSFARKLLKSKITKITKPQQKEAEP